MEDIISISDSESSHGSIIFYPPNEAEEPCYVISIDVGQINLGHCVVDITTGAIEALDRVQLLLPQGPFNAAQVTFCVSDFADALLNRFPATQKVLIERQVTNTKNGMIEFMLHGYFSGKGINCLSIDPSRTKMFLGDNSPSYHKRKRRCARFVEMYLRARHERYFLKSPGVGERFFGMIKKDDVADAVIQFLFDAEGLVTIPEYPARRQQ